MMPRISLPMTLDGAKKGCKSLDYTVSLLPPPPLAAICVMQSSLLLCNYLHTQYTTHYSHMHMYRISDYRFGSLWEFNDIEWCVELISHYYIKNLPHIKATLIYIVLTATMRFFSAGNCSFSSGS